MLGIGSNDLWRGLGADGGKVNLCTLSVDPNASHIWGPHPAIIVAELLLDRGRPLLHGSRCRLWCSGADSAYYAGSGSRERRWDGGKGRIVSNSLTLQGSTASVPTTLADFCETRGENSNFVRLQLCHCRSGQEGQRVVGGSAIRAAVGGVR